MAVPPQVTFRAFLRRRDYVSGSQAAVAMLPGSLRQQGFHLFWRRWNPYCGYILFQLYRRSGDRKPTAVFWIFALSGFWFHDVLIYVLLGRFSLVFTVAFLFYACVYVASLRRHSPLRRLYRRQDVPPVLMNLGLLFSGLLLGCLVNYPIFPGFFVFPRFPIIIS
ncbi:MAG: hypothetical protein WB626_11870 [Bacteroidota bacterium]